MASVRLAHREDRLSLLYLALFPAFAAWQWKYGFSLGLYFLMLIISVGLGVIHHNHTHLRLWRSAPLNRATDLYLSAVQAIPTFVFGIAHVQNHHRYRHGEKDETRTYRFGGDHNHFYGYLLHPFQALQVLLPKLCRRVMQLRGVNPRAYRFALLQVGVFLAVWIVLAAIDGKKFLLYWFLPQMHGLHWLLGANYLQHAHADGRSDINYARNFLGPENLVWFNIGYHTAHHENPRAHWSELPTLHAAIGDRVDPRLVEPSLASYVGRSFFLGALWSTYRSRSLMQRRHADV